VRGVPSIWDGEVSADAGVGNLSDAVLGKTNEGGCLSLHKAASFSIIG